MTLLDETLNIGLRGYSKHRTYMKIVHDIMSELNVLFEILLKPHFYAAKIAEKPPTLNDLT